MSPTSLFARVCIGLVVSISSGCDHVRSFESVCEERAAPTQIEVNAAPVRYATDFTRSHVELAAMDGRSSSLTTLGLVTADMQAHVEYTANGITQRRTGRHCMRPSIHVQLAYSPMMLYVSREQPEGSCAFRLTMEHELKHVRTFREFLPHAVEEIETSLRAQFGNRLHHFASEAEANAHVEHVTREVLSPLVSESMARVKRLQAQVDAPGEYARMQLAHDECRLWSQSNAIATRYFAALTAMSRYAG